MDFFSNMWDDGYRPVLKEGNANAVMADIDSVAEWPCPECESEQYYDGWYNGQIDSYMAFAVCHACGKRTAF
jgi:sulfur transfer protein SufE